MFDSKTRKFLKKYLPTDYRKRVHERMNGAHHPTQISHVRMNRRDDDSIALEILAVAKEEKARREEMKKALSV